MHKPLPMLHINIDRDALGKNAYDVVKELLNGDPLIAVAGSYAEMEEIGINTQGVTEAEAAMVGWRLREVLTGS